ncbi:MAG TPA: PaeR7I family type II restriction endonuclease [Candidatus Acidoferrales bacterium]|nr:PaeR7I family type II restriction endonuclease [Candidatus Acidoferrales bacterium]
MSRAFLLDKRLREAIKHFWSTRETQAQTQGSTTGLRDAGTRTAVTGGRQMDGFVSLVQDFLCHNGLVKTDVHCETRLELPGWYRPEKKWDLLVVSDGQLMAGIEFKSQVGSFGNNYNNRTEEAIGSAVDIWAAYREGAFKPSARPWLGYLMLLEDAPGSTRPVRAQQPHFKVFPEFKFASYAKRYEILLMKLVRERLYDSACFLMSNAASGPKGRYSEPISELCFKNFMSSLLARAISIAKT